MLRRLEKKKMGKDAIRSFKQSIVEFTPIPREPMVRYILGVATVDKNLSIHKAVLGCKELSLVQFYISTFGYNVTSFSDDALETFSGDASMELVCFIYENSVSITSRVFLAYVLFHKRADIFESKIKTGIYPFRQKDLFLQSVRVDSTMMLPWLCYGKDDEDLEKMLWDVTMEHAAEGDMDWTCIFHSMLPLRVFMWCLRYHNIPHLHISNIIYSIASLYFSFHDLDEIRVDETMLRLVLKNTIKRKIVPVHMLAVHEMCALIFDEELDIVIRNRISFYLSMIPQAACNECMHPELHKQ